MPAPGHLQPLRCVHPCVHVPPKTQWFPVHHLPPSHPKPFPYITTFGGYNIKNHKIKNGKFCLDTNVISFVTLCLYLPGGIKETVHKLITICLTHIRNWYLWGVLSDRIRMAIFWKLPKSSSITSQPYRLSVTCNNITSTRKQAQEFHIIPYLNIWFVRYWNSPLTWRPTVAVVWTIWDYNSIGHPSATYL